MGIRSSHQLKTKKKPTITSLQGQKIIIIEKVLAKMHNLSQS